MGVSERFPVSLNAVNVVCFKIDWEERMLNVLLVKRSISPYKNKWSLPGGFVQGDETLEEAAKRNQRFYESHASRVFSLFE